MSVTLVDVDATWVNPSSVSYNASELRLADASLFAQAGIVRNGANALGVSVDGSDVVTVQPGLWVIPGNAVAGSGVWRSGIASAVTGSLEARDATYGRIDLVVARQLDTDVVASHAAYTGRVEIIKGTPSATPGAPALPNMAVELGRISVPASGGGAASVDLSHRTYATAVGAEILVPSFSTLPPSAATEQKARTLDNGRDFRWNGSQWALQSANGSRSFTFSNESSKTATINFPSSFVAAPKVFLTCDHSFSTVQFVANSTSTTASSFTLRVAEATGTARSGSVTVYWRAEA